MLQFPSRLSRDTILRIFREEDAPTVRPNWFSAAALATCHVTQVTLSFIFSRVRADWISRVTTFRIVKEEEGSSGRSSSVGPPVEQQCSAGDALSQLEYYELGAIPAHLVLTIYRSSPFQLSPAYFVE